jgi:glutamyl-tRNA synthetase
MLNFLALLGWSPGHDIEIMTVPQMIELFSVDGLSKKAAVFDPKKLEWMNGQHLGLLTSEELAPRVTPALVASGLASDASLAAAHEWYIALLDVLKVRARTIDDIVDQAFPYFAEALEYDDDAVAKQWKDRPATADVLAGTRDTLAELTSWDTAAMEQALRHLAERRGVAAGKLFQPLRVALTGRAASPGIFDVLRLLGREKALRRIDSALQRLALSESDR